MKAQREAGGARLLALGLLDVSESDAQYVEDLAEQLEESD